jgi:hypothetical protein
MVRQVWSGSDVPLRLESSEADLAKPLSGTLTSYRAECLAEVR